MKPLLRTLILVAIPGLIFAQTSFNRYSFKDYNKVKVMVNGDSLINAWAGGMNWTQFNTFDLNNDNIDDLLIFDKAGNRLMPFLVETNNGNKRYKFAPHYIDSFPTIEHWMLLIDYNCDGRKDLFTSSPGGIGVYKNTGHLNWQWALAGINIKTFYDPNQPKHNLYVSTVDIPAIVDVDNDGDLDIFTFGQGNTVQHHEGQVSCGLDFKLKYWCWGGFEEGGFTNKVELDKCNGLAPPPREIDYKDRPEKTLHSGSSILLIDLTGNNLYDALIGDISFNNCVAVYNNGTADSAHMYMQDTLFPKYNKAVDLEFYPAFFYEDVTFDGKKDLIAVPHIQGTENYKNTWLYKNTVSTANPTFSLSDSSFIQNQMIDMGEAARPVFIDLNYDQKMDLLICNSGFYKKQADYKSRVYHYENVGSNNNPEYKLIDTDFADLSTYNLGRDLHVTFHDLDGDFDLDMLVGNGDGKIQYFENQGLLPTVDFVLKKANFQNIDVGSNSTPFLYDVNQDSAVDLIIGNQAGLIYYYKNNKTTNLSFTLETDNFGGIDVKSVFTNQGFSVPIMFKDQGKSVLMVGSYDRGILQYDSIDHVLSLPSSVNAVFDNGTIPSPNHEVSILGTSKKAGRNQLLFKASELQAQGLEYGKITNISVEVIGIGNPLLGYDGLQISMKLVTDDSLTSLHSNAVQTYYSITSLTTGWLNIPLQFPFTWDGQSNLLVEFCFSKQFDNAKDIVMECTDMGFKCNAFGDGTNSDNQTKGCKLSYAGSSTLRPNMKFTLKPTFIDVGTVKTDGQRNAAALYDLDGDGYREMILGNTSGGVRYFKGVKYIAQPPISVVENSKNTSLKIYPNPAKETITINWENEDLEKLNVKIYNLSGMIIIEKDVRNRDVISIATLNSGLYILQLSKGGKTIAYHKLVILND